MVGGWVWAATGKGRNLDYPKEISVSTDRNNGIEHSNWLLE